MLSPRDKKFSTTKRGGEGTSNLRQTTKGTKISALACSIDGMPYSVADLETFLFNQSDSLVQPIVMKVQAAQNKEEGK